MRSSFKAILALFLTAGLSASASAETFEEALISAYNSNPTLKAERARLREIDENYIQARAQGRFQSSLQGSISQNYARYPIPGLGTQDAWDNPAAAQVQIIQPLYQGGRVKALKSQANSSIMAAREALRNAEQQIMVDVATAYVDVRRDEQRARIRRNNVSVLARQEQAARERFDVGEGTLTDISQAEARLAAASIGLAQADAVLAVSRAAYTRVVGHSPVNLGDTPRIILPTTLEDAKALARENNPQLVAANFNSQAAEAAIDVAKSAGRPAVSLNATAGAVRNQLGAITRAETAEVMAQFSVPLYAGGANKSRVRQARQALIRTGYEIDAIERAVDEAVTALWAQLEAARLSLRASDTQVSAAQTAFDGVELEQQIGTRTTLDVLDAEQELLNAKLSVIETRHGVSTATYQLLALLGAFDAQSLQLPVDYYDPALNLEELKSDGLTKVYDQYVPDLIKKRIK